MGWYKIFGLKVDHLGFEMAAEEASMEEAGVIAEVGWKIAAQWNDGTWHQAEVVHRQKNPVTKTFEYYVHYCDFNRRLDEWVTKERLNFDEVTKPEPASKNEERGKKRRKRKDPEDDK